MRNLLLSAAAVATLGLAASPAAAGVVTFENTTGQWANWVGGYNVTVTPNAGADDDATIRWGKAVSNNKRSGYNFEALDVSPIDLEDGETSGAFSLAKFEHVNYPITKDAIQSVDLLFNTDIWVDGAFIENRTFTWTFTHEETPNDGSCPYGGTSGNNCNDRVLVAYSGNFGNVFSVGLDTYTLFLAGFEVKDGNKYYVEDEFITKENKINTAKIRGKISMVTSAVPEPATWAMMLGGFFAVGGALRRGNRRAAAA